MLEFEDIEETHTQAEQALKAAQAEAAAENQDLSAELQSLEKDMLIGNADRERMLPQIPAEDLEIYESSAEETGGIGCCPVEWQQLCSLRDHTGQGFSAVSQVTFKNIILHNLRKNPLR